VADFSMPSDAAAAQFVTSNVVGTLYHELGHALIDQLQLPVLGREEDAADTLASLLIDDVWTEDSATNMITDSANAYLLYDAENQDQGNETPYWDVHGLDLQRYYNLICLFYGASPDTRGDMVTTFDLPSDRADGCPSEYEQAQASWGVMLDDLAPTGKGLRLAGDYADDPIAVILAAEIETLNARIELPEWVDVAIDTCGEANAFYDPAARSITICSEYAADLARVWAESEQ
jgi:hypothetical protein